MSKFRLTHAPFLLVLWLLPLGIYLKTLAPSILYIDAGTIVAAAFEPGIPNPPGFPFYIMVAHLFTKIPFGSILFRVQLLSIISALGVLALIYFLLQRFLTTNFDFRKKESSTDVSSLSQTAIRLISLTASLILAFSYQFWSQTLNSESYIFTNFLLIICLILAFTFPTVKNKARHLLIGGVVLGLATGANPTIVQVLPSLILVGILFWKEIGLKRVIPALIVAVICMVAVYSYLPIRASANPFLNWGNPQTPELFLGHLHGAGLNIYDPRTNSINGFTGSSQVFFQSIGRYIYLFFVQFTPLLIPLILLGCYYLFKKNIYLFLVLILIPLVNMIFGALYLSGNQESWFIASYVIFTIFLGIGLSVVFKILLSIDVRILESRIKNKELSLILTAIFLILIPLIWWFPKLDRSNHVVASEYADNLYANLLPNSVLIGSGDFFNSLTHYEYGVTKRRTDVFPVVANMWYILPWYRENLRTHRPDLMPAELEGMIKMNRYEEYNEVMNWYIKWLLDRGHPVYVTPLVFRETVLAGSDMGKYRPDERLLKAIPSGLAFRMVASDDLLDYEEKSYEFKFKDPFFYRKTPFYLERNYNAAYNLLLREYGLGYAILAEYFLNNNNAEKADEYINKAYEFAPFAPEIVNRLAVNFASKKDMKQAIKYFQQAAELEPGGFDIRLNLAKALVADGQMDKAKVQLQMVIDNSQDQAVKQDAQSELSTIEALTLSSNVPSDWKTASSNRQGVSFRYPKNWQLSETQGVAVLSSEDKSFSLMLYGGTLQEEEGQEEWLRRSPIRFSGVKSNSGLAKIPEFDAIASFWDEDGTGVLELVLVQKSRILHLKIKPLGAISKEELDTIISTIKFLN